ncbi:MAG: hypothetical protein MNPFHGCM_00249 [Gemmatimonadaceae bacterium]|nr:hypothetical protein [Gemmatimonadaceae bacterium]
MAPTTSASTELEASLEALHESSFGWARSCCDGDREEAHDVLHTTYVKILSGRARFEGRSTFRTWLFGVIRLTALEERRASARQRALADWDERREADPLDAALIAVDEREALRLALARLPARQQEVLHLVFYQDLSIADAAEVMGISVGSARTHYERGKKRLRTLLFAEGG